MNIKPEAAPAPDSYLKLIRKFPITMIRDDLHWQQAIETLNGLMDRPLDASEQDYLDALATMVEVYEDALPEFGDVGVSEIVRHLMDANGDTQTSLCQRAHISKSLLSEILSGERPVTLATATKLADAFHVPKSTFID